jgi:hypothetical protein
MAQDYVNVYRQLIGAEQGQTTGDNGWADSQIALDRC